MRRWVAVAYWGQKIVVDCPACDAREGLPAHQIRLHRCTNKTGRDYYSWRCPACRTPVAKYADTGAVALLTGAGVASTLYRAPLEIDDRARRDGGRLTVDDALDFSLALADWDGEIQWQQ